MGAAPPLLKQRRRAFTYVPLRFYIVGLPQRNPCCTGNPIANGARWQAEPNTQKYYYRNPYPAFNN